jgi:hypothetical protein
MQGVQVHFGESEINRVGNIRKGIHQCAIEIVNNKGNFFQSLVARLFGFACCIAIGSYNIFFVKQDDQVF